MAMLLFASFLAAIVGIAWLGMATWDRDPATFFQPKDEQAGDKG